MSIRKYKTGGILIIMGGTPLFYLALINLINTLILGSNPFIPVNLNSFNPFISLALGILILIGGIEVIFFKPFRSDILALISGILSLIWGIIYEIWNYFPLFIYLPPDPGIITMMILDFIVWNVVNCILVILGAILCIMNRPVSQEYPPKFEDMV